MNRIYGPTWRGVVQAICVPVAAWRRRINPHHVEWGPKRLAPAGRTEFRRRLLSKLILFLALLWVEPVWALNQRQCCIPGSCDGGTCLNAPSTCGAGFVEAWGNGVLTNAVQPGTSSACDSSHACQETLSGAITGKTFFGAGGEIGTQQPFVLVETLDFADAAPNGTGGECYPVGGQLSITDKHHLRSTLILDFQGSGCQLTKNSTQDQSRLLIKATYFTDGESTGRFAGTTGTGELNLVPPTSLPGPALGSAFPVSFSGNLHFALTRRH